MTNNKLQSKTGELIERLLKRGERIVVLGDPEPMVLLPLSEYEELVNKPKDDTSEESSYLEPLDTPSGTVEDEDQYYPESI